MVATQTQIPITKIITPSAAQVQLIPASELAPGQAAAIRNEAIKQLLDAASEGTNYSKDRLVVRDIRPLVTVGDLDYTYEDWSETTGATANAWETMSTGTNVDQRWIGFYGVKVDPDNFSITAIRFNVGGSDRVIWQLQSLNLQDDMVGYCPSVIVIPPNAPYTISRWVRSINSIDRTVLKGTVVEPRGKVISP